MKCQNLFSGENKKKNSIYCLLKILPRVLSFQRQAKLNPFPGISVEADTQLTGQFL